jgi:hypothetical protein
VLDYFFPDDGQTIAEGIISGSATAVSDGSFKSQFGTSGFVIRGNNRRLGAIGVDAVPGLPAVCGILRSGEQARIESCIIQDSRIHG